MSNKRAAPLAVAGLIGVGSLIGAEALAACGPITSAAPLWYSTPTTPTTAVYPGVLPGPSDFKIGVTIIKEDCFGTAGCNVKYEIFPTYIGTAPLTKKTFRVIYKINGGDSPQTDSFTVTGGKEIHYDKQGELSTDDDNVDITAVPTEVIPEQE